MRNIQNKYWWWFGCLIVFVIGLNTVDTFRCDSMPDVHGTPLNLNDGRFELKIAGNPTLYVPHQVYTVSIESAPSINNHPHQFNGFMLTARPQDNSPLKYGTTMGHFEPLDSLSKFYEYCPNSIIHSSLVQKTNVQVQWTAPEPNSGCVTIKASVMQSRTWYKNGASLNINLCEDKEESFNQQPLILDYCCACDEAKYEVILEGLWSRQTHPKNFPNNSWEAKFSDVMGASHSPEYQFWQSGQPAGEGLHELAANGSNKQLESEFKNYSNHIRTIIKARGITNANATAKKTFAVFRVNNKHHLISLVSKIIPSPDWIIGVSSLELCLSNCSWVFNKEINLFPYDVGTEEGVSYKSEPTPTVPRDKIRRITSSYPTDPDSPFFDSNGAKMQPLARLYLTRLHLYEKQCVRSQASDNTPLNGPCEVNSWQKRGICAAQCNEEGVQQERRTYVNPNKARLNNCNVQLTREIRCRGLCLRSLDNTRINTDDFCALTDWSEWSSCSSKCGLGHRTRNRVYRHRNAMKKCTQGQYVVPILQDTEECIGNDQKDDVECTEEEVDEKEGCNMTPWTNWTPCSVTCGAGIKTRRRSSLPPDGDKWRRSSRTLNRRHVHRRVTNDYDEDPCENVRTSEEVVCIGEKPSCDISPEDAKEICSLPKDSGTVCDLVYGSGSNRGIIFERWYFNQLTEECEHFNFTGCGGNANKFDSIEKCQEACLDFKNNLETEILKGRIRVGNQVFTNPIVDSLPPQTSYGSKRYYQQNNDERTDLVKDHLKISQSNENNADENEEDEDHETTSPVDCELSQWSDWSPCQAQCDKVGYSYSRRGIVVYPANGGKQCPKKLERRRRCRKTDCNPNYYDNNGY